MILSQEREGRENESRGERYIKREAEREGERERGRGREWDRQKQTEVEMKDRHTERV